MKNLFFRKAVNNYSVYVLKLQNGKYYIGITPRIKVRINEHKNGTLSNPFVQNNLPINVVYHRDINTKNVKIAEKIEDYYTVLFIKKFGLKQVLGGHVMGDIYKRKRIYKAILSKLNKQGKRIDELDLKSKSISGTFPEFMTIYNT